MNVATFDGRRLGWRRLVALLLVPLLVAGSFLAATWNFNANLHKVTAAVVNNDEMVTIEGQPVPLGRQLSANLVDTAKEQNFTWVLADTARAEAGLATGQYAAVVTIPKNFSAAATSYAGEADSAHQATITIQTSPVAGIAETALGQSVADAATQALNDTLTKGYLDNVYIGFNTMGKQFVTVADGAGQLADGASQLSSGARLSSDGAAQLASGMTKLTDGGVALKSGGAELAAGGAPLASGAGQLSDGLALMADQTKPMPGQIQQLADGSAGLSTGMQDYANGVGSYVHGINSVIEPVIGQLEALPDLTAFYAQLDAFMADLPAQATGLNLQMQALSEAVDQFAGGIKLLDVEVDKLSASIATAKSDVQDVASGDTTVACPADLADVPGACEAFARGVKAGGAESAKSVDKINPTAVQQLAKGLQVDLSGLQAALKNAVAASDWLVANAADIQAGWADLSAQLPENTTPDQYLLEQLKAVRDGGNALTAGGQQLAGGMTEFNAGVQGLNAGIPKLVSGIAQSADGAKQLSDGVGLYTGGVSTYVSGVGTYVDGVSQASDGAGQLADGLAKLAPGAEKLSDGSRKLADGLADGAKEIPSYDSSERTALSTTVASPVSTSGLDLLVTPGSAAASLLLVLALWLGALATFALIKPVDPRNASSSSSTAHLLWRTLLPGFGIAIVQSVLLAALGAGFLRLDVGTGFALFGVLLLSGLAFVAVNHALAAWAGVWGRLISGAMLLVTAVCALTSAAPEIFAALRPLSPASPALDAVRSAITGHAGALAVVALLGWLGVGLLAGAARIVRSRTVSVRTLALAD